MSGRTAKLIRRCLSTTNPEGLPPSVARLWRRRYNALSSKRKAEARRQFEFLVGSGRGLNG